MAQAAETDRLLPAYAAASERASQHPAEVRDYRRRTTVAGVGLLALLLLFLAHSLTQKAPPPGLREVEQVPRDREVQCTSQVLLMRRCEKTVNVDPRVPLPPDMRDKFGNGHCSARGRERADYIATLFVAPDDGRALTQGRNGTAAEGAPPVAPVDRTGETRRFPPPVKLYALSSELPKHTRKKQKEYETNREIDTLLPLATKFQLDVDARFGVAEEDALVAEYFASVSQSVEESTNGTTRAAAGPCDRGLTLVNWKYSRIPRLARAFGCGKEQGCPNRWKGRDFDSLWLLTFRPAAPAGGAPDATVDASTPAGEPAARRETEEAREQARATGRGRWTVTGEVVQEGFDQTHSSFSYLPAFLALAFFVGLFGVIVGFCG